MLPESFVTWLWPPVPGYRSKFGADEVNKLQRMVKRNADFPHRFICVTNQSRGIDPAVEVVPDREDFADVPAPSGRRNPSCFRRLRAFAPDIGSVFGSRFVSLDLDMVITGPLRPLFDRPEGFVIITDTNPRTFYNGSMFLLTAGARSKVWETFHPVKSPQLAHANHHHGSDQAWISHCLGKGEATWTKADGVYSFKNHIEANPQHLPDNARVVVFHGNVDPWSNKAQALPWVKRHYN